jgi:type I restriction-modification system DNA methylase subunit
VIEYDSRHISDIFCTNFLDTTLDSTVYWKTHIDQLLYKLSSSCYAVRILKQIVPQEMSVMVYYAYFHSGNGIFSVILLTASIFFGWKNKVIRIIIVSKNKVHVLICLENWIFLLYSLSIFFIVFRYYETGSVQVNLWYPWQKYKTKF